MALHYSSGEEIEPGDEVTYRGDPGYVEFIIEGLSGDPRMDWYVHEHGAGVMLHAKVFGTVYVPADDKEDLTFVARRDGG
jgi:hypothetical protein